MTLDRVAIIGAGLGGLTCAIALRRNNIEVDVYEAAARIEETGAGLTLGLGAQHVYRALGVQGAVAAQACPAGNLPFLHYRSGDILLGGLDTGDGLGDDGTANIVRHIYRANLQNVLLAELERLGGRTHTGHRLAHIEQSDEAATAHFDNGTSATAPVLVGADGVRSAVRAQLVPGDAPRFTGHVAYRFLVPIKRASAFLSLGRSAIFIGPQRTFNRYTMAQGRIVNGAALVETREEVPEGWSTAASVEELEAAFAGWHPEVTGLIGEAGAIIKWGLYDRAPLESWSHGRVTMLGDAAHAMLPFLGMGAAMAVEDGYVLAQMLARHEEVGEAFAEYERRRIPRTAEVHHASKVQGEITQSIDPDDFALAGAPVNNRAMMEFDPTAEFA
ncbi:FAD-dependent monooxygenase [Erythrobacter sp. JK5]|uniref:FAD-dependent monooxygenase n=1 Tax=Erythrobacter sp. JK5 TaxID=2829500 RepID=UPI001BAC908C|nr:FAD-dependent monooxygenase [Erythrobacter sp. JK5]QUL36981.1 FAD-dependent monooxygenase [Erythrobacter sp. JK5]